MILVINALSSFDLFSSSLHLPPTVPDLFSFFQYPLFFSLPLQPVPFHIVEPIFSQTRSVQSKSIQNPCLSIPHISHFLAITKLTALTYHSSSSSTYPPFHVCSPELGSCHSPTHPMSVLYYLCEHQPPNFP